MKSQIDWHGKNLQMGLSRVRILFIFPSETQLKQIQRCLSDFASSAVLSRTPPPMGYTQEGLNWYTVDDFISGEIETKQFDIWHCCHELAVYFVSRYREFCPRLQFSKECLDMLTKLDASAHLALADIPILPKTQLERFLLNPTFPCIVKPNFGFASTYVKRITSIGKLKSFWKSYEAGRDSSMIGEYKELFVEPTDRSEWQQLIVEPDVSDGRFLSIAFVASPQGLIDYYLVEGNAHSQTAESDFIWHGFHAPVSLAGSIEGKLVGILDRLARAFATTLAVFEIEAILQPTDDLWVLEFSPRLPGGSISALIKHAYGVDVEKLSIDLTAGKKHGTPQRTLKACTLRRIESKNDIVADNVIEKQLKRVGNIEFVDVICSSH